MGGREPRLLVGEGNYMSGQNLSSPAVHTHSVVPVRVAKYPDATFGFAESVFNKLGGLEGARRFLADEIVPVRRSSFIVNHVNIEDFRVALDAALAQIHDVLAGRGSVVDSYARLHFRMRELKCMLDARYPDPENFRVWKSICVSQFKDGAKFLEPFAKHDVVVQDWARSMLVGPEFRASSTPRTLPLILMSVGALGFPEGEMYESVIGRLKELQFALCPADVGPQLRLEYLQQPEGEWILVAMNSIRNNHGELCTFVVSRSEGKLRLTANKVEGYRLPPTALLVVTRSTKY